MLKKSVCTSVVLAGLSAAGASSAADTWGEAIRESDFIVDWRLRYESVDQAGVAETAEALTGRLRFGFQTAPLAKTRLLVEGVWVGAGIDDYNSTTNGRTQYPIVADPAGFTDLNRFALSNKSLEHTTLTFGRQRIVLDDTRFVGNVAWRQDEQTFDGLRAQIDGSAVKVDVSWSNQVNRVFGPDSPVGRWHGDVVLANVGHAFKFGTLTAFDYFLDLNDAPAASSNTLGLRLAGTKPLGKVGSNYTLSYARQADAGANPATFSVPYAMVEGGLTFNKKPNVTLGYERMGSNGTVGFSTPLATSHAFQGWADKFLATPAAGIDDTYVKFGYPFGKRGPFASLSALVWYHDFSATQGSAHFGNETDLQFVARTKKIALTLKYATYDADVLLTDTDKLWLSVDYSL
ncbi:MAG: alginate export family protein [Gammaproteobacteria bacterium]